MDSSRSSDLPKIYIYHADHEHDRTYTENVVEYLGSQGVLWRSVTMRADGLRPELQLCLDDGATAVLGYNSQLDHSWLASGSFVAAAAQYGVPVIQWILDHPCERWHEFTNSTAANSRFLLNSVQEEQYFQNYCLSGALTGTMGGVGPNPRSHIGILTRDSFMRRPITCMIPLSLRRIRSIEENEEAIRALERPLAAIVYDAIARARNDLVAPLQVHLTAALAASDRNVPAPLFNRLFGLVEQAVQIFRRLKIFVTACRYPVSIQSDKSAAAFMRGSTASLETDVGMQLTLARMPMCRAILGVSPINDMIHDRTMNALNGGCVAIAEANSAMCAVFTHKVDALLFRYDDDSLEECFDIVCHQPARAYEIAQAGMKLRDDPRLRFGQFHNLLDLARARAPVPD
ncbi:MAG TPA: hypothetical protein VGP48_02830 [Stellaceae bacterium]|jgi:hypothetical protein|nr:hypothetical protein [Stellaceae bacterium]